MNTDEYRKLNEATGHIREALLALFGDAWFQERGDHIGRTPERIAKYWAANVPAPWSIMDGQLTVFANEPPVRQLVVTNAIPYHSLCLHHFLPFEGHAYIGYKPDEFVAGLSKFPRVVRFFAQQPQTQEHLARQVADYLYDRLKPTGLIVMMDATHTCTTCRGVEAQGVVMSNSVVLGDAGRYDSLKAEFMELIRPFRGIGGRA